MPTSNAVLIPDNVKPVRYQITLEPNLDDFTFKGQESVEIEVLEPTDSITLNSVEIVVESCQVIQEGAGDLPAKEITYDEEQETATFRFDSTLPAGPARLDIGFTGTLNDRLRGFYRSQYTDIDGNERYMATTQFESTDARRAFPCWDEPLLKASFDVTLVIPSDLVAVSNMPVVSETPLSSSSAREGLKSVRFAETPTMSTYLLAFIVGDLSSIERRADNGTLIRIWTTRGNEERGRFALETSIRLLEYFNAYFGIPYPLPKLDHLAIPDFAAGAMENWGAITYRETALLFDPENSSAGTRQTVASIIAHEMAHMWFGDLVTMKWWNDLWLNESFASWMGDKAVDSLFPEWEVWTQFISGDTNRALSLDGLKNSHPIEQGVSNPAEIEQMFDAISYSKGASVLRMLEHFLSAETFRQGLHQYLTQHQYANAERQDLWDALAEVSGTPVAEIMDTWVMQTGYPVLDVQIHRGDRGTDVRLSQRRFVYEDILGAGQPDETLWRVPVGVSSAYETDPASLLMETREATARVNTPQSAGNGWIKVNPLQTGFYRVRYPSEELKRLAGPIRDKALPAPDRLGIQGDAFALTRAGLAPAIDFLTIAEAYSDEDSAHVCADLSANLESLGNLLWDEPFFNNYEAFSRSIFQSNGRKVGWDAAAGEGHLNALLRSTVLNHLGSNGDEDTLREASARFARYVNSPSNVKPDIRGVVFKLAAIRGDRDTYDTMWKLRAETPLQEEKVRLLMGLSSFEQAELLGETLERSLTDEVRVHDTVSAMVMVAGNRHGRDLAWQFLKDNWAEYDRRYGEGGFALMRLVSVTSGFTTLEMREDVERFFTDHPVPGAERSVRQSLERIQLNAAWLEKNREELGNWFVG